jgi:hypothetical protein
LLALLVLRPGGKRDPKTAPLLFLLAAGLGTAALLWPFGELIRLLPGLAWIFPIRFLSWAAFASATLAALELDRLTRDIREDPRAIRWVVASALLLGAAAIIAFIQLHPLHAAAGGTVSQIRALVVTELTLLLIAGWGLLAASAKIAARVVPLGFSLLAGFELFYQGERYYRFLDPDLLDRSTPLVAFLQSQPPPFRIVGERTVFYPNSNVLPHLEEIRTHDPSERRDYVEFLDQTCGYEPEAYFKDIADLNAPALDFLNVRYLISSPNRQPPGEKWREVYRGRDGTVFENDRVLFRAFSPRRRIWIPGGGAGSRWTQNATEDIGSEFRRIARETDWKERAYLTGAGGSRREEANPTIMVQDYRESAHQISFRAVGEGRGALVLSVVQDGGWRARDDRGNPLETTRANGPFLALLVPAGDHRIALTYTEPGFWPGAIVSGATVLLLLIVGGAARSRKKN